MKREKEQMSKLKRIIYNCRQATFLIEKRQESRLTFREEIELRIHLHGCDPCKLYKKQSLMIGDMVRTLFNDSNSKVYKLGDTFKKTLQERIVKEMTK